MVKFERASFDRSIEKRRVMPKIGWGLLKSFENKEILIYWLKTFLNVPFIP